MASLMTCHHHKRESWKQMWELVASAILFRSSSAACVDQHERFLEQPSSADANVPTPMQTDGSIELRPCIRLKLQETLRCPFEQRTPL